MPAGILALKVNWPTGFLPVAILAQASLEEINFCDLIAEAKAT